MPVCTNATPKAVTFEVLNNIGYEMIVSNAYHLFLRPGSEFIKKILLIYIDFVIGRREF